MATRAGVTGQAQITARLRQFEQRFGIRMDGALYRRGVAIATDSQEHFVPIDLGPLKNEIRVFPPERIGRQITVTIAAGTGTSRAYAVAVHEHPSKYSPPSWKGKTIQFSPAGTGVKFLERPAMKAAGTLLQDIASDLALDGI